MTALALGALLSVQLGLIAPPELEAIETRFQAYGAEHFEDIANLVGLEGTGDPITVILAPEGARYVSSDGWSPTRAIGPGSHFVQDVPKSVAGYASTFLQQIVIFPDRIPGYPHSSLEDVLRHEVTHILISRAAGRQTVPRWFNEGLAMAAERSWGFRDQSRLVLYFVAGPQPGLSRLDQLFASDDSDRERAYALSGAFVHYLIERFGAGFPARLLARIRERATFETAFRDATGRSLGTVEAEFWSEYRVWTVWVPTITSSTTLWILITILALIAIRRRVQKNREIERRWDDEDGEI